ncbi:MAG TPA: M1 family aminopeptidase [Polyangiales bacterium]|nr:M1 family aminopeptidase [Polyangiales bacterium]
MIGALIGFEWRLRRRLLSTYVYALSLFAAGAFLMLGQGGVFRSMAVSVGNERVHANSPYALFNTTAIVCLLGLFMVAAVFGQAVYRDFGHDTWTLIFTKNVSKQQYLLGRFAGAFWFSSLLMLAVGFGQLAAAGVVYFVKPERLGPLQPMAYLWPYLTQVWPMLFFAGALFFSLAALTRRMAAVYVAVVVLVLGYLAAGVLMQDIESRTLAALLDPFGFNAFEQAVRYWTPAERNRDLVSPFGLFGLNRVLWSGLGCAFLLFTLRRFRPLVEEQRKGAAPEREQESRALVQGRITPPTAAGWIGAMFAGARLYCNEIARSAIYWAFVLSGLAFMLIVFGTTKQLYGTATLPVTYQVLELARNSFQLFALITLTFYAGELACREHDAGVQDLSDATRVPSWVVFWGKLLALWAVALSLVVVMGVAALVAQLSRGFVAHDYWLYPVELLGIEWSQLALIGALAFCLQSVIQHKYLAHAAMVVYFVSESVLGMLGVEDRLLRYGAATGARYSDMNGFGGLLEPWFWYRVYWCAGALLLLALAYVLTPRGRERALALRLRDGRARFGRSWRVASVFAALIFAGSGAFIFYNTHVLNPYLTDKIRQDQRARYERDYSSWQRRPQPRAVDVHVRFDIYPERRRMEVRGRYGIQNKSTQPIEQVLVWLPDDAEVRSLRVAGTEKAAQTDLELGVRRFDLPSPLSPGARAALDFELVFEPHGFRHSNPRQDVAENGTFFSNDQLPLIGYQPAFELARKQDREDYGLPIKQKMASRDDRVAAQNNYVRIDSDFIDFSAEVSTPADQIALAPGYLQSSWLEGGRRISRFTMDQPILNFFSVLSARYQVTRDRWRDVPLEIYHHPGHDQNLQRMLRGMKDALEYCSASFGPYQHRQARILEFPRYAIFAQAFPNTIPYSEALGFIARVRDDEPSDINYPYYVTAHEIAHQWWAHQVIGANVRGATMTTETLAQYTALMVMQRAYQARSMRRFLKFELDGYLTGRATEQLQELPLAHNENQPYIHYQKGSLAMYALADYIGEERVNRALRRFLEAWKFRGPPYPTAGDLVGYLREETPAEFRYLIDDLFETITLYDNRVESATLTPSAGGGYDVALRVVARKFRASQDGSQSELTFADYIDIGALDADGNALTLERRKIGNGSSSLQFHVAEKPAKVGIDPLNKLIDRQSDDNVLAPN